MNDGETVSNPAESGRTDAANKKIETRRERYAAEAQRSAQTHAALTDRTTKAMAAAAAGTKPEGRRRTGLNKDDQKQIVEMLRSRKTWDDVLDRFKRLIEPAALEGMRAALIARAKAEPQPRIPEKG